MRKKPENKKQLEPNVAIKKEINTLIKELKNLGVLSLEETIQKLEEVHKTLEINELTENLKKLKIQRDEINSEDSLNVDQSYENNIIKYYNIPFSFKKWFENKYPLPPQEFEALYNNNQISLYEISQIRKFWEGIDTDTKKKNIVIWENNHSLKNKSAEIEKENNKILINENITKDEFLFNTFLTILSPTILFIITLYLATWVSANDNYYLDVPNPFNWEITFWVWAIFLIVIFLVEQKLFLVRKRSKYFKNNVFRVLYYLSSLSTIAGSVAYFMTINVQLFSRVGRSSRDGFLLQAFFFCYILPVIFWMVYYAVIKNNDAYKSFLEKKVQKRNREFKVVKREQAIKELKEAKDLLDLGILSKEEYDNLSAKLKPFILGTKP